MNAVVAFPLSRKRGAKKRTGPSAEIVCFCPLDTDASLLERWTWLFWSFNRWEIENHRPPTRGPHREELDAQLAMNPVGKALLTSERRELMYEQIEMFERTVIRRARLKTWLRSQGARNSEITSPDEALDFLFKRDQGRPAA